MGELISADMSLLQWAVCSDLLRHAEPACCMNRHELPADKALLRLRHYYDSAPEANAGNAAMHLANFALHAVAARSARLQDPRMRSLRSVGHLQVRFALKHHLQNIQMR